MKRVAENLGIHSPTLNICPNKHLKWNNSPTSFKDEVTCLAYLEQQRWGGNPVCPFCGAEKSYHTDRGYKCRNKECHKKFTVKVGTICRRT